MDDEDDDTDSEVSEEDDDEYEDEVDVDYLGGGVEDDDDSDGWPKLHCEPLAPREELLLDGDRPGYFDGSQYPQKAAVPAAVNQYLRSYQKEGISWMWGQYVQSKGGILGDEMGLGKTVQVAAFLMAVLGKTAGVLDRSRPFPLPAGDARLALIVVPSATMGNWERELSTWGYFRVRVCHGAKKDEAIAAIRAREAEILLTTYDTMRINLADFRAVEWEVTIFDEAQKLKNEKSKLNIACHRLKCNRRFGLTGTPMSNKYEELWVLFDFVSAHDVGSKKDFRAHYGKALKDGQRRSATNYEIRKRVETQTQLWALISKWMLQRFKWILADQLPKKSDNIVFCRWERGISARQPCM